MTLLLTLALGPVVWFVLLEPRAPARRDRPEQGVNPLAAWRVTKSYGDRREGRK